MKTYGFKPEPITIGKDYVEGGSLQLGGATLNPSGDWRTYVPKPEEQNLFNVETYNCTNFGNTNCVETLHKFQYGTEINLSDRFLGKVSGITIGGGSPHRSAEFLRKLGSPEESQWTFTPDISSFEAYHSNFDPKLFDLAKEYFHNPYSSRHSYVPNSNASIKQNLKLSPLGVSVCAWFKDEEGFYYKPEGVEDNHWCELVYVEDGGYEKENHEVIFDSYPEDGVFFKKYRYNTPHHTIKRYQLGKKSPVSFQGIIERLRTLWQR